MTKLFRYLIILLVFFPTKKVYDSSETIKNFVNLIEINEKWAQYYFDYYELGKYKNDITGKYLTKENIENLGLAIMKWESNINNKQKKWENKVREYSYGQYCLLGSTAKYMGWEGNNYNELLDPEINAKYSIKYLCIQLKKYDGNIDKALAAYNAGKCRYDEHGKIRNYYYVENVYNLYQNLNKKYKKHSIKKFL